MTGHESPLRVIAAPTLGTGVMEITSIPKRLAQWQEEQSPPVDHAAALASLPRYTPDPVSLAILDELRGLRADLASRTFAGRCRRAYTATVTWLKGLWP